MRNGPPGFLALALLLLLPGCSAVQSASSAPTTFINPVYRHNFPDPYVLQVGKTYYAYATNWNNEDVQVIHSTDLVHWTGNKDAMPVTARWIQSDIWAPEVLHRADGKYVLYYTARDTALSTHCLGFALAGSPAGPFLDRSARPAFCQPGQGGDIDPDPFRDTNNQLYLYWKNDGNSIGMTTYLYGQKMSSDGLHLTGKAVRLVHNNQGWEGAVTEAPTMWKQAGKYYLFFSGNGYASYSYATGYATCKGPLGPCTPAPENPILTSKCKAAGPGGQSIIRDARGQTWIVYHAWIGANIGDDTIGRQLWIDRLDWKNGKPVVHGPTCTRQPAPAT